MLEAHADSDHSSISEERNVFGRTIRPWTDGEHELIAEVAEQPDLSPAELRGMFPGRSLGAIRGKIARHLEAAPPVSRAGRKSMHMMLHPNDPGVDDRLHRRSEVEALKRANARFLDAVRRAGYPVTA